MKNEFFLEEAVLDDLAEDFDLVEMPLSTIAFRLTSIFATIIVFLVFANVSFLGIWKGDFYKNRALANAGKVVSIPTERGMIYDRFGIPLVKNTPVFRLEFKVADLIKERGEVFKSLNEILGIQSDSLKEALYSLNLEKQDLLALPVDLTEEQAAQIKNLGFKSVQVKKDFKREYLNPKIFSHILGYTAFVGKSDIESNPSFDLNDLIGKSGIEKYYDNELRGAEGKIIYYRDAKGNFLDDKFLADARSGEALNTTIDSEFQIYFYEQLKNKLNEIGSESGVGIVLNPQNGEVLALVSLPGFDNNKITKEALFNSDRPFFNRAISGLYSPGSTIKPLVAFAALKENVVNPEAEIYSRGYIEIPNPYFPDRPSRFVDWKPQGWVDLYSALARSSNVYFYALGGGLPNSESGILRGLSGNKISGLGIEKLKQYWEMFGLNESTGIDLPSESYGFLPDPETKENKNGNIWRIGDTYNVAIGQGDLMITPIELVNYIAAVANGGKFYKPFINKQPEPQIIKNLSDDADYFKEIQRGMADVVSKPYGTAHLMSSLPMDIAGKTGSAQIENNKKVNAFFVGYAPADNPQIAILVLIEKAREGSLNAVPVAKNVLEWYYYNRLAKY